MRVAVIGSGLGGLSAACTPRARRAGLATDAPPSFALSYADASLTPAHPDLPEHSVRGLRPPRRGRLRRRESRSQPEEKKSFNKN